MNRHFRQIASWSIVIIILLAGPKSCIKECTKKECTKSGTPQSSDPKLPATPTSEPTPKTNGSDLDSSELESSVDSNQSKGDLVQKNNDGPTPSTTDNDLSSSSSGDSSSSISSGTFSSAATPSPAPSTSSTSSASSAPLTPSASPTPSTSSASSTSSALPTPSVPPAKPLPFAGLANIGNSCYMNATMQIIAALYKDAIKDRNDSVKAFIDAINSERRCLTEDEIKGYVDKFPQKIKELLNQNQQDATEFMIEVNAIAPFLCNIMRNDYTFYAKNENIYMRHENTATENPDYAGIFSIPILPNVSGLSQMIRTHQMPAAKEYTSTECKQSDIPFNDQLFDLDAYCYAKKHKNELKQGKIIKYTALHDDLKTICIQLGRFGSYDNNIQKINDVVSDTFDIHITPDPNNDNHVLNFTLNGFIVHEGASTSCGHYVAYVKRAGVWYKADDRSVEKLSDSEAKKASEGAYLLFYRK